MSKHTWSSKWVFILAAIGSAAGLGNIWKFPFLVYDHGGGAFIIAYLVLLFFVGISILIGEIALGQKTQSAGPNAFAEVHPALRWLGWAFTFGAFSILSYYVVVIGWSLDYLFYSLQALFTGVLPWAGSNGSFFFDEILGITSGIGETGNISSPVLWGTIVSLIGLYFFTRHSAQSVGKVILVTATLPFITLFILAIRAITLPGGETGLSYLGSFDTEKLLSASTWIAAGGQIFFTLSLAMGVMIIYGAFQKKKAEIAKSVIYIAIGNTLISFLSAFAVFGTLGYLSAKDNVAIQEVASGGPSLAFVVIPETLATFASFSALFSVIFFITLFLLAIDSAMALLEGVTYPIKQRFSNISHSSITAAVVVVLGIVSIRYMYGNGLYVLDIIDYYIQNFFMLFLGLIEILVLLWGGKKLVKYITGQSDILTSKWYYRVSWALSAAVVGCLLYLSLAKGIGYGDYALADLLWYGVYPVIGIIVLAILINIFDRPKVK